MAAEKILLGTGTFAVGGVAVGLTRGGGSFTVERTYRHIEADGDRGPVEGRTVIDTSIAKMVVNGLELFTAANLTKFYPGLSHTDGTITGTLEIAAGDYNDVVWIGATADGDACTITIQNALNLSNLEWSLEDKNEVVPSLEFTAHYAEASRDTEPWSVVFA